MQSRFMAAIRQLATEKNLPLEKVLEIVSHALRAAYRKDYGNRDQNIRVDLDPETAQATVYLLRTVMEDGATLDIPDQQIHLSEAKKYKKGIKVGEELDVDVTPADYGRIAAQSAKQVIIQRIQEAEKDIITQMYLDREHEILSGYVNRVEGLNVYVDLDRTQAVLRPQDQIPRESYQSGQRIKVYLEKVVTTPKGPRLLISRSHPRLVNCLLELEIPEVREGVVEVKSVAREAGVRTKVAVASKDPNVDPIGACVGQKGVRIQNVMEEFNGERIDILEYTDNPIQMLHAALSPSKISFIDLDPVQKRAKVYLAVEERALAIGKGGQNVRLASLLTGWEIDIVDLDKLDKTKLSELQKEELKRQAVEKAPRKVAEKKVEMPVAAENIKDLPGLTSEIAGKLETAGFVKSIQLMGLNAEALTAIEGITMEEAILIEKALKGEVASSAVRSEPAAGGEAKDAEPVKSSEILSGAASAAPLREIKKEAEPTPAEPVVIAIEKQAELEKKAA